jgi:hypothetical protein
LSIRMRTATEILAWITFGMLVAFDLLCLISALIPLLVVLGPLTTLIGLQLSRRTRERGAPWWAAAGAAAMPFFLAYTNRHGPGTYCHPIGSPPFTGTECGDEWDPRPWLAVGLVLVAAGPAGFLVARRRPPGGRAVGGVSGGGRRA